MNRARTFFAGGRNNGLTALTIESIPATGGVILCPSKANAQGLIGICERMGRTAEVIQMKTRDLEGNTTWGVRVKAATNA